MILYVYLFVAVVMTVYFLVAHSGKWYDTLADIITEPYNYESLYLKTIDFDQRAMMVAIVLIIALAFGLVWGFTLAGHLKGFLGRSIDTMSDVWDAIDSKRDFYEARSERKRKRAEQREAERAKEALNYMAL